MRCYVYKCDICHKTFGIKSHFHLKNLALFKEVYTPSVDVKARKWVSETIYNSSTERHFCNIKCFIKWAENNFLKE